MPLLTINDPLLLVFKMPVCGLKFKSPSIVVTVFPVSLTLPISTRSPSIKVFSTPLSTVILPIPLKSIEFASMLVSPVSKSTKKLSPTLNLPFWSVLVKTILPEFNSVTS